MSNTAKRLPIGQIVGYRTSDHSVDRTYGEIVGYYASEYLIRSRWTPTRRQIAADQIVETLDAYPALKPRAARKTGSRSAARHAQRDVLTSAQRAAARAAEAAALAPKRTSRKKG